VIVVLTWSIHGQAAAQQVPSADESASEDAVTENAVTEQADELREQLLFSLNSYHGAPSAQQLAALGEPAAVAEALRGLCADPTLRPSARVRAIDGLGFLADASTIRFLRRVVETPEQVLDSPRASTAEQFQRHAMLSFMRIKGQAGVGALLKEIEERELKNVRIYSIDANEVIDLCLPDASVDRVLMFFPDPWHKKRHHKRRLVQPEFAQRIRHKLRVGGIFHLTTDWENYSEHMMEVLGASEGFVNTLGEGGFSPRPKDRPKTKFEERGLERGHGVWDLVFRRTN
jgi:tRNA (guanine-N(7)-)-methyltransferase